MDDLDYKMQNIILHNQIHKSILGIHISEERNKFGTENFIHTLVDKFGKHSIHRWWYVESSSMHLKYRLHSPLGKFD
jgi:hypothetical protein